MEEAVNLKKLKKEYDDNEDRNNHTGNYLLLAKAFGTPADVKKVQEILKRMHWPYAYTSDSKKDMDWIHKNLRPYYDKIRNEEVEIEEGMLNLKKLKKEYEKNEDDNYHRENYLLLAKAFGTKSEIKKVEEIMKRSEANNSTSQKDNDWMYKNIMPYYNKIRNEEVDMDEAKGTAYPATIDTLRKIVKDKQHQTVMFKSGQAIVDLFTASAMVQVYDALKKPEMKKTFEKMIGDKAGFLKTQAFAMKMLSGGK